MAIYTLNEIVEHARTHSEFYQSLYQNVPYEKYDLSCLPIIDQDAFWQANTIENNRIMTGEISDGIIFKSGGTTGNPKYSVFSKEEWNDFTYAFGQGMLKGGLKKGEKVANLFYGGDFYASFLFISKSIDQAGTGVNYPIGGLIPIPDIILYLQSFSIKTLAGLPVTLLKIADYIINHDIRGIKLNRILFGGESMYPDQRAVLADVFKGVEIHSIGYAGVDSGELGYVDSSCEPDEHRIFGKSTILEIIDEDTGNIIQNQKQPGKILITNLSRKLMPLIRYPVGDRAIWVEPKGKQDRKFRLIGRTEEGARIGPMTLYIQDILKVLNLFKDKIFISNFQILIVHEDLKDGAILRLMTNEHAKITDHLTKQIIEKIYQERHMFSDLIRENMVNPLKIEWIASNQLICNKRTGKVKRVIDQRFSQKDLDH
ncbi:phenylacetate-CoA ligase [Candidatus Magnetomoraceae bacterium gMMP-15]